MFLLVNFEWNDTYTFSLALFLTAREKMDNTLQRQALEKFDDKDSAFVCHW